jgi:hypothetical protein
MLPSCVTNLSRDQLGIVDRPQLLALGLTPGQVDAFLRQGHLEHARVQGAPMVGTYRVRGGALVARQALMAAVSRARPVSALTGPALLGCLGVEGFTEKSTIMVRVPVDRWVTHVPFTVLRDPLIAAERAALGPIRASTATRALLDAALVTTGKPLRVAVDSARWRGLTHPERLRRCAERLAGHRHEGATRIMELLDEGTFEVESEGERAMRPIFASLTPPPRWQHWVAPDIRVDMLLGDAPVVCEYLGEEAHGTVEQRKRDDERDRGLRRLGYLPVYVTKADLEEPHVLLARVLGARDALLVHGITRA